MRLDQILNGEIKRIQSPLSRGGVEVLRGSFPWVEGLCPWLRSQRPLGSLGSSVGMEVARSLLGRERARGEGLPDCFGFVLWSELRADLFKVIMCI